jgi:3-methyladenine DNA glycosylase AlkD
MQFKEVIQKLKKLSNQKVIQQKRDKFGIQSNNSLGIYHKDLDTLAKQIGKDTQLALALFDSEIYEARILCSKIFDPSDLNIKHIQKWVRSFENWEICDSFSMKLFAKSNYALKVISMYSDHKNEFSKRACYSTIAAYCMADKNVENKVYISFISLILNAANDERVYVKKSISWALRNIGKRNKDLNKVAILAAQKMKTLKSKSAVWISNDVLRELQNKNIKMLDYPRSTYRR